MYEVCTFALLTGAPIFSHDININEENEENGEQESAVE